MPIYAFACRSCGHHFDRLQRLSDADPDCCPQCGEVGQIHRELTAPQFRLAGTGWYETDFKSKSEHRHNLAGDAARPAGAKPAEAKSAEGKPAATAKGKTPTSTAV